MKITDEGLAHFEGCKKLTRLNSNSTPQVTDKGLAHFRECKSLTTLDLAGTQVSDAGLGHFAECKGLTYLDVRKTKVTAPKINALKRALPKCKIEWDGG